MTSFRIILQKNSIINHFEKAVNDIMEIKGKDPDDKRKKMRFRFGGIIDSEEVREILDNLELKVLAEL